MPTPYLGDLKLAAFNFAPKGWALCNGQVLSIAQNQALFSLLGTQYGGGGRATLSLPPLRRAGARPGGPRAAPRPRSRGRIVSTTPLPTPGRAPHPHSG